MESDSVLAVGCLNNDRSVLAKSYAWRPLALLPILKGSACLQTNDDWVRHRRMELYHSSMDHIIADINELCSKDMYLRFADGQVRCSRPFYHLLVMDGQEVGAALMCDVNQSAMEGRFLVKSLWIKLWNSARRGCRNPGLVALRQFGAGMMQHG